MRVLTITPDFNEFVSSLYSKNPGLEKKCFSEQMRVRMDTLFLWADFYAQNLRKLDVDAIELFPNNAPLQQAWARENGFRHSPVGKWSYRMRRGLVPWPAWVPGESWIPEILGEQIRHYRPDILLVRNIEQVSSEFLEQMRPYVGLIVGQHASPFRRDRDFRVYDLLLSSLPNYVEFFRGRGFRAELLRLAFEPSVLQLLHGDARGDIISFVGTISDDHRERVLFLDRLCSSTDLELWGTRLYGAERSRALVSRYRGAAFGIDMFRLLRNSAITVNHHESWAEQYANNMRLYEATGVGTLLITDWKVNLHEMFDLGKEVVTYRSPEECAELVHYYVEHKQEREQIAASGQKRTLSEHTYYHRMQEFMEIVRPLM